MLNPILKLNPKLFDPDVEVKPTRAGYGDGLVFLGDKDKNVVALTADLCESTKCDGFANKFPERFFDLGVAEQNLATVAAGMGVTGKTVFISSYATFNPGRNWEQIRTTIVYNQSNVKIAGHHTGVMTGPDGATHQATEDIAITRCWPDINIFVPSDSLEAKKATILAGEINGPVYLRFSRDKTPIITTNDTPFDLKSRIFWITENPKVTVFATGYMLYYALLAAKELEEKGINVLVVNVSCIKPLDEKGILESVSQAKAAVAVEDHQVMGGLGGMLSELFAKNMPIPMEFIGLQNTFAESGTPIELLEKYKMDKTAIVKSVEKVILRKV